VRKAAVIASASGNGKTTFGRALAQRWDVPFVELDALVHGPGWTEASDDELREQLAAVLASDGWVIDGTYWHKLGDLVVRAADVVIWLDLPVRVWFPRLVRRTIRRVRGREELWNGNRETLRNALSRDSIVWWVITQHRSYRKKWPPRLASLEHVDVVRLRTPREVRRWLQSIQPTESMSGSSKGSERQKTPPLAET
jgi:adenylate kinase family enzyme